MITAARNRIVILGAGFGGLYTARKLQKLLKSSDGAQVTLISRDNFFVMTPLLFEGSSGVLEPRHVVNPIRTLFKRSTRVQFVQGEILAVDLDRRSVTVRQEDGEPHEIGYEHLVIALGGMTNTRIVPGSDNAMTFKTLGDAIYLRNHVIQRFEQADVETNPDKKRAAMTFVVIGAGFVGVELAGELTEFLANVCRTYNNVHREEIRIELIEAGPRIAPEFEESMSNYIATVLRRRGVTVRTATPAQRIEPGRVILPDGTVIDSQTILVATGVTPSPLVATLPVEKSRKGAIVVDAEMRVKDRPAVWALGDCASIPDPTGKPYPPLAQHALREAKVLARNIVKTIRGEADLEPFVYETKGLLAAIGHYNGVGRIKKIRLKGFLAWWVWRSYYLFQMPQWSRRARIIIDWTVALLFRIDVVQLDLMREKEARGQAHD